MIPPLESLKVFQGSQSTQCVPSNPQTNAKERSKIASLTPKLEARIQTALANTLGSSFLGLCDLTYSPQ